MANADDEFEDEAEHWTPESDKDPERRINGILDRAEKHLTELTSAVRSERPPAPAPVAFADPVQMGAQIEIRRITNGFVMTYPKAIPYQVYGKTSGIYCPSLVEAFFTTAAEAFKPLEDAILSANLLSQSLENIKEHEEALRKAFPPRVNPAE